MAPELVRPGEVRTMPYANIWEPGGVTTRFSGFVTAAEYVRSAEDICADPRFDGLRFVIKDLLAIEGHDIDRLGRDPVAAIRYGARFTNPNIYLVLLTTDARLLPFAHPEPTSTLHGLYATHAFASADAARRWLAVQPPLAGTSSRLRGTPRTP